MAGARAGARVGAAGPRAAGLPGGAAAPGGADGGPPPGGAGRLTWAITRARDAEEVLDLVHHHLQRFDHIHTTTCLHALARHRRLGLGLSLGLGLGSVASEAAEAAEAAEALAEVGSPALAALVRRQEAYLRNGRLDGRQLSNTIWAAASLAQAAGFPEAFLGEVADQLARHAEGLNHQDVANGLWALAVLRVGAAGGRGSGASGGAAGEAPRRLAECRALSHPRRFKPQELANSVWALAHVGGGVPACGPLVSALAAPAAARRSELEHQHLSNVLWAVAAVGPPPRAEAEAEVEARSAEPASPLRPHRGAPERGAPGTLRVLFAEAGRRAGRFKAQELANTVWALATTSAVDGLRAPALGPLAGAAVARLPNFKLQELTNTAWAFTELPRQRGGVLVTK